MDKNKNVRFTREWKCRPKSLWICPICYFYYDCFDCSKFSTKDDRFVRKKNFRGIVVTFVALFFIFSQIPVFCATISLGSINLSEGEKEGILPVEIELEPGEKVSGVQFDIVMPTGLVVKGVALGQSAQKANKMATYNMLNSSTYRIIVAGLNREILEDGSIALIKFELSGVTTSAKYRIKLSNVVLADPDGNSVPCVVQPGFIIAGSEGETTSAHSTSAYSLPIPNVNKVNNKNFIVMVFVVVGVIGVVILLLMYYFLIRVKLRPANLHRPNLQKGKTHKFHKK